MSNITDRDRLIELIEQADNKCANTVNCGECEHCGKGEECINRNIADYLLANGVIVPPCKVGDIVYAKYSGTNEIEYYVIDEVTHLGSDYFQFEAHLENEDGYTVDTIEFGVPEIGLTVFLTEEEAEAEIEKRGKVNA